MNIKSTHLTVVSILFITTLILLFIYLFSNNSKPSPELSLLSYSQFSKTKAATVAASCGFTIHGSADETASCTYQVNCCYGGPKTVTGTSQCGGTCSGGDTSCTTHPNYGQACTSAQNACGQTSTGTIDACGNCTATAPTVQTCSVSNACGGSNSGYQCPSGCTAVVDNSTCVANFKVSTDQVNPNGSVEFSWTIPSIPNVGSKCGFVDLTTATPRSIPGLQNLDPTTDRVRITNIQTTTRFCLVCQFYNLTTNATIGDAAVHQWVRVIRIGED